MAVCGGLALILCFLVISAVVGAQRWLSRDCEACVCRHKGVTRQYCHSVILMILSTAVGAGNVAGHIRCYMASAGPCDWVSHNKLMHRWSSSSSKLYICTYGTVCTWTHPCNPPLWRNIRNFFSIMPALCSMLMPTYYAQNYAGIIHAPLTHTHQQTCISSSNSDSELSSLSRVGPSNLWHVCKESIYI